VPLVALAATLVGGRPRLYSTFGLPLESIAVVLCLDWALRFPTSGVGGLLNAPAMAWIGTISYSLYVWQELFLDARYTSGWMRFPLNLIWVAATGLASYYLIERPALALRRRLERGARASAPSPPAAEAAG
jgi:peptidoglycan/LPS O-acetylase OafA/YrhL